LSQKKCGGGCNFAQRVLAEVAQNKNCIYCKLVEQVVPRVDDGTICPHKQTHALALIAEAQKARQLVSSTHAG
jgi:hypothetical protein